MSSAVTSAMLIDDSDEDEGRYYVGKVLDSRIRNGRTQYLCRWKDYPSADNTWELEEDLVDDPVVKAFKNKTSNTKEPDKPDQEIPVNGDVGYARGLKAERIYGVIRDGEITRYFVKWSGVPEADLVLADEVKSKSPEVLIQYYEDRSKWCVLNHTEPASPVNAPNQADSADKAKEPCSADPLAEVSESKT